MPTTIPLRIVPSATCALFRVGVIGVLLLGVHGCRNALPDNLVQQFEDWFVQPSPQAWPTAAALRLRPKQLDSLAAECRRQAKVGRSVQYLTDAKQTEYALGIYTPLSMDSSQRYPLIVYLHGGVGAQQNTKGERAYEMFLPLTDSMPLLLASPSANRSAPWWSAAGMGRILQTVRYMTLHYPVDPERIILAGVSDGATGAYAVANAACGPFAGFICISGFGGMLQALGMRLEPGNLMQRPIYNVNAGNDRLYPLEQVNAFLDGLQGRGVEIIRKEYLQESHGFDYRAAEWDTILQFLRRWRRPTHPGIAWTFVPGVTNSPPQLSDWSKTDEAASIHGHQSGDTLYLSAQGLKKVDIILSAPSNTPLVIRTSEKAQSARVQRTVETTLSQMYARCVPYADGSGIVTVHF